mmetsp:Transcript_15751/g.29827  ORF Transcript_15751/g.29827 Transcript_15751/m.29827 type:complete len:87 (-) Transcript_15751:40-300(-)
MERKNVAGDGPEIIPENVGPPVTGTSYVDSCDTSKKKMSVPSSDDDDDCPPNPFGTEAEPFGNLKTASLRPGWQWECCTNVGGYPF